DVVLLAPLHERLALAGGRRPRVLQDLVDLLGVEGLAAEDGVLARRDVRGRGVVDRARHHAGVLHVARRAGRGRGGRRRRGGSGGGKGGPARGGGLRTGRVPPGGVARAQELGEPFGRALPRDPPVRVVDEEVPLL